MVDPQVVSIGIDLGTTYSSIGVYDAAAKKVEMIKNEQGYLSTPSYVSFAQSSAVAGHNAKQQAYKNA